jgi:hypothetical protein
MAAPAARELTVAPPPTPATPQTPSLPSPHSAPDPLPELPAVAYNPSPARSDEGFNADPPLVEEPTVPRRSARTRRLARRICDLMTGEGVMAVTNDNDVNEAGVVSSGTPHAFSISEEFSVLEYVFAEAKTSCAEALEPRSLAEAKRSPNWPHWEAVIHEGWTTPKSADTRQLEHAPPGSNVTGSKGILKLKNDIKRTYLNGVSMPEACLSSAPQTFNPLTQEAACCDSKGPAAGCPLLSFILTTHPAARPSSWPCATPRGPCRCGLPHD